MEAFATVNDLESRWRVMDAAEKKRAETLLMDAAIIIMEELERSRIEIDPEDERQAANLVRVSCDMVLRVMEPDVPQEAWGVNAVVSRPGALYISKQEKRSFGIGRQRIGFVHPWGDSE